ncbi:MAG TPA: hypothetical protein EYP59_22910, partial [Thiotrichaceae bacterium]|nr:hypothetical protein [Thiotrichaceae bacterium]
LEGFANVAARTGASSVQLGQSLFGLTQGLTTGTLRAEELNQITEPLPGLLQQLDKAAGLAAGGFRKMVNAGQITSDMLRDTLLVALQSYEGAAEATAGNLGPTFTRMTNAYTSFKNALEQPVSAILIPLMETLTTRFKEWQQYVQANHKEIMIGVQNFKTYATAIGDTIVTVTRFLIDNRELILILIAVKMAMQSLIAVQIVSFFTRLGTAMMALLSIQWAGFFGRLTTAIVATSSALIGLQAIQIAAWFTSGATGALALVSILGKLSLILAAGFAVVEIVKLTKSLYDLYKARQQLREAEQGNAEMHARGQARLKALSEELGIAIPNMKAFSKLVEEGVIVPDEALGQWVKAKEGATNYAKEIQKLQDTIAQNEGSLAQKKQQFQKLEANNAKAILKDMLNGRIQINTEIIQNARLTTKELVKLEQQATDKIKALRQSLADEQLSVADKIRELRRKEMGEENQQLDLKLQIMDKLGQAEIALSNGNGEEAKELANQAKSLSDGLTDIDVAIVNLEKASDIIQSVMQNGIKETQLFKEELSKQENSQLNLKADISQAETAIETLKTKLSELKDKTINVRINQVEAHAAGGIIGFDSGGKVPGIGNTDSVPALLTPGEFVIKQSRALKFRDLLNLINYAPLNTVQK